MGGNIVSCSLVLDTHRISLSVSVFDTKTADWSVSVHSRFGPGFDDFVSVPFLAETKVAFLAQSETERGFDY